MKEAVYSKDLFARLKSETAEFHDRVESMYPFDCLVSADLKVEEYTDALVLLKSLHLNCLATPLTHSSKQFLEPRLDKWTSLALGLNELIDLDLSDLKNKNSITSLTSEYNRLEHQFVSRVPLPETMSAEEQLGALYVVLGSSLGAKFIYRHLQTLSSLSSYRHMYFSHSASRVDWRLFKQETLDLVNEYTLSEQEIVNSAVNTFTQLNQMQTSMLDIPTLESKNVQTEIA